MTRHCGACGRDAESAVEWQEFADGSRHVRASCPACGAFIRYLPHADPAAARAKPRPKKPAAGPGLFDGADGEGGG